MAKNTSGAIIAFCRSERNIGGDSSDTDFNEGYRYADFNPGVDKVATYGIAALIGGKMAAKAGLLAKLGGLLVAFKKIVIVGFLAVVGFFSKLFKRRKAEPAA